MFSFMLNLMFASSLDGLPALPIVETSVTRSITLVETQSRTSKVFKIVFNNLYGIVWDHDDPVSIQIAESIKAILRLDETQQSRYAEVLKLQSHFFMKMLLDDLVELVNGGCAAAGDVLSSYVMGRNAYIENPEVACGSLSQLNVFLNNERKKSTHGTQSFLLAHDDFDRALDGFSGLGRIYIKVLLEQKGQAVTVENRQLMFRHIPDDLKKFVRDDMAFVELYKPRRITPEIEAQMRVMREEGATARRISQRFGFSEETVWRHTQVKPQKGWAGCFSSIFGADSAADADLLTEEEGQAAGDQQNLLVRQASGETKKKR